MTANDAMCRFKFQALSGYFFDYREEQAQHKTLIPATTLPCLGLVDKLYDTENTIDQTSSHNKDEKPWQRFKTHVESLNAQDPSIAYKVVYITRHGFSHHNAFMAQVSRDAWNVSIRFALHSP
jgi:hypothetical protein